MLNTVLHYNPIPSVLPQDNQPVEIQSFFKSEGRNVYAFSDIHADINVLIILLRDLAGVIKKRNASGFDQNVIDPELEHMLNIDIRDDDNNYDVTLGYEWIPRNNSYVVIIGDILDGIRGDREFPDNATPLNNIDKPDHYYPQVEIKILRFINAINISATQHNGKIFKLFGNHEIGNMINNLTHYAFFDDLELENYYRGHTRYDVFKKGNAGFKELIREGCRVFLVIDNYIFIHGQLVNNTTYDLLHTYTNKLNNTFTSDQDFDSTIDILSNSNTSELWLRKYGDSSAIHNRESNNRIFCETVNQHFTTFITQQFREISGIDNPEELKIVIGHCVQSNSTILSRINKTFTNVIHQDTTKEILIGDILIGETLLGNTIPSKGLFEYVNPESNRIFGITMECKHGHNSDKVFRVDVGSSRAFDTPNEYKKVINQYTDDDANIYNRERKYLFSRTPQLLHIQNNIERIIRSKIKNTRIHQPRSQYENKISEDATHPLQLTNPNYQKKYLKYKQKYLELKKLLN
jgi:hypothetical protein